MNKTQLVDALAARIGDRRMAANVVDGLIETIVDTVRAGGSVSLSGFGVFESRARAARVARNPRTGETVQVPPTTVPAFRAGLAFRTAVGGGERPGSRTASTDRVRSAPAAVTNASAATEAAAVADAPARVARGRSKAAAAPVDAAPKGARKNGRKKPSAPDVAPAEKPVAVNTSAKKAAAPAAAVREPTEKAVPAKSTGQKAAADVVEKPVAGKASGKKAAADRFGSGKAARKAKKDGKPKAKKSKK